MTRPQPPAVIFLHPSDEMYGADRQLLALVRGAAGQCRPVVLLPDDISYQGVLSGALRDEGFDVRIGRLPVLRRAYASPRALAGWLLRFARGTWWVLRIARSSGAPVIVSNSAAIPVGPIVALLLRRRHLWYVREIVDRPAWFRRVVRLLARLAPGTVLTVSDAVGGWLGPIPGRGPRTLHDGVAVQEAPAPLGSAVPMAAFVGRLNEWKGWEVFARAAGITHSLVPDAHFRLVGGVAPGSSVDASVVARVLDEVDPGRSWLTRDGEIADARAVMRDSWLVVVPSIRPDPFPNVVLEAMAEGRAVVGTDIGGIPEMVVEGVTGSLVPPGDVDSLAHSMARLLSDRSLAEGMGARGHQRARAKFSVEPFTAAWRATLGTQLGTRT